jgi:hypothetical protein
VAVTVGTTTTNMVPPYFSDTNLRDEDYTGPKHITVKGKRYVVETVIHCAFISGSDVRCWVPMKFPDGSIKYLNHLVDYLDMRPQSRKRFFTEKARATIWGKKYARETTNFYVTKEEHDA